MFLWLAQTADSKGAGLLTDLFAPTAAFLTWHQQAENLATHLGGSPNNVGIITGTGWSTGVPSI